MHRATFPLIAFAALLVSHAIAQLLVPGAAVIWSRPWLAVWVFWALAEVPLIFRYWSRYDERREKEVVDAALAAWRQGAPDAAAKVAKAILTVVEHEDVERLQQVLEVLAPRLQADPHAREFHGHALAWLELNKEKTSTPSLALDERYGQLEVCAVKLSRSLEVPVGGQRG